MCCWVSHLDRVDLHYISKSGTQRLLSYTDWNAGVAALHDSGALLFGVVDPIATEEVMQPQLAVLRNIDGSPPQVLGRGYPLDLSSDGQLALVQAEDTTGLTALPTGPGEPRVFATQGLRIVGARFLPGNTKVVAKGNSDSSNDIRLFVLDSEKNSVTQIGQTLLGTGRASLHLSADGRTVATPAADGRLALISIPDGSLLPVPPQLNDGFPVGWFAQGHLWFRQGGRSAPAHLRLFRADPKTGQVLEERTISPPDLAIASYVGLLAVSPSGEHVVFFANRTPGQLLIARGLWHPE
jgi:hypothetical protein